MVGVRSAEPDLAKMEYKVILAVLGMSKNPISAMFKIVRVSESLISDFSRTFYSFRFFIIYKQDRQQFPYDLSER